ncbi:L-cystine-binding protein TcyK [Bifidobacterium callitrichos]|nr:L-cystine-binding protein TcyK [Bifidobacterium callitrichos]
MNTRMRTRAAIATAAITALALTLAGCGSTDTSAKSAPNDADATTVQIGVGNVAPFDYVNEDGQLDGYEVKVLQAVDDDLPQYSFKLTSYDFSNLFASIDSGKVEAVGFGLTLNKEREEKYDYTHETHLSLVNKLIVAKDSKINSLDDLAGKTVYGSQGEAVASALENYNKANPDKAVKIQYAQMGLEQIVAALDNGTLDAYYGTPILLDTLNKNYGDKLKYAGEPLETNNMHFFIKKGDTKLQEAMDKSIKKLRDSGKLAQLSKDAFGEDYTKVQTDGGLLAEYEN